jgi:hypothetical protein
MYATDRVVKISESRRKMLGIDAPAQQEIKTNVEVKSADDLRAELAEVFAGLYAAEHGHD